MLKLFEAHRLQSPSNLKTSRSCCTPACSAASAQIQGSYHLHTTMRWDVNCVAGEHVQIRSFMVVVTENLIWLANSATDKRQLNIHRHDSKPSQPSRLHLPPRSNIVSGGRPFFKPTTHQVILTLCANVSCLDLGHRQHLITICRQLSPASGHPRLGKIKAGDQEENNIVRPKDVGSVAGRSDLLFYDAPPWL